MSLSYDEVVPRLIETCEGSQEFESVRRFLLVQTLTGRVRLVLEGVADPLQAKIEGAVQAALGAWFEGPVISPEVGSRGLRRLAAKLWTDADQRRARQPLWSSRWPEGWLPAYERMGAPSRSLEGRWEALQVTSGKDPWLRQEPARPPWGRYEQAPRITAFYGFKGGVGRTTTLAVLAWRLAQMGQRVVCLDLDLEAPGLSAALTRDGVPPDVPGVLDAVLTHAVTGEILPTSLLFQPYVHDVEPLYLAHAGHLSETYVEKLARLDLAHRERGKSPVHLALRALLKRIRAEVKPDHIFLDCRSGLHDLAGLALHDLAHVDVFVGRGDRQEMQALPILLRPLLRRRAVPDQTFLFLRTFHELPLKTEDLTRQREDLYETLADLLYAGDPPAVDAEWAPHDPCPIGVQPEIAKATWLGAVSVSTLLHETFGEALERLDALWRGGEPT